MLFTILATLALLSSTMATSAIKGPPTLSTSRGSTQITVTAGENVKLPCAIEGSPPPIFEWAKGDDVITEEAGWERFRHAGRILKVREVEASDEGTYVCTAVNGFGQQKYSVQLLVVDPLSSSSSSSSSGAMYPGGMAPEFTQVLPRVTGQVLQKPMGHSIKLKCQASGHPEPEITWLKDGVEMPMTLMLQDEPRLSKHSLHIPSLKPSDSGTYTCAALNPLGAVATNWTIQVVEHVSPQEPKLTSEPSNTTTLEGGPATLTCRGTSDVRPHIKWLKRVEEDVDESEEPLGVSDTITWQGARYVVLKPTEVMDTGENTFLAKLMINPATKADTGLYVCTATNNFGFSYSQAHLTVLSKSSESTMLIVVIAVLGGVGFVLLLSVSILVVKRRNKQGTPPAPAESALLPGPGSQVKLQQAQQAGQQPRYVPHPSLSPQPHGHAVGPEGPLLQYPAGGIVQAPAGAKVAQSSKAGPPIIVYQDPAASVYIASRSPHQPPPINSNTAPRHEYQYQHLDVI
ncbi:fibroblast growth factor receptor-like 1 [Oratosquilla oratoria]|uniref:fibroblast growth factor receptor-like 1 n=1 Tax=Oratosquilla oratoria TaxID=337810 RepID=UPI003F767F45